ncbi:MAG: DegT/DnrJ/EryC1/StrS family aminotransferase [Gammaproteobacteria bacterium]
MKFIDLKTQYQELQATIDQRIRQVIEHGRFILGPEVKELEERLAQQVGVKHCIAVANGTDALLIALMALGIGPGDEVITSPFSFIATAEMVVLLGAKPVFVDIEPYTYNLDPNLIAAAITPRTKAILPVNLYGQCADFDAINAIAHRHGLPVIEDAAQSIGATYKGRQSGSLSTMGCTSFFPSKPLGCYGDGGACFTNDDQLAKRLHQIYNHGQEGRYNHVILGINSRLATLQAAILLAKLDVFPEELQRRQEVAKLYQRQLSPSIEAPYIEPHNTSVYAQYTVRVPNRDWVKQQLQQQGIPTAIHYPVPLHKQPVFSNFLANQSFPIAERASAEVLSLPFHPYLKLSDVQLISKTILQAIPHRERSGKLATA